MIGNLGRRGATFGRVAAVALLFGALVLLGAVVPAGAQRTVELTLGHPFSPEHHIHTGVIVPLVQELEEKSGGRIKVTVIPGGGLAGSAETYEAVVSGVMDIGWTLPSYTPGRFPLTDIIEVPFLFWPNSQEPSRVLWRMYERHAGLQQEYGDVKVLGMWSNDPRGIFTRERAVRTLEDLQGQRIRALGAMEFAALETFDAVPVGLPAPAIYDALERGVIDGVSITLSAVATFHFYDTVKHVTITNHGAGVQIMVMNLDTWNSLSPEDQALIDSLTGERLSLAGGRQYDVAYQTGLDTIEQYGIEVHYLSEEDMERWRVLTEPVAMEPWLQANADRGGRELYELMLELAGASR